MWAPRRRVSAKTAPVTGKFPLQFYNLQIYFLVEYNLLRADEEYRNGNVEHSIYYQVKAQFQSTDLRYLTEAAELENQRPTTEELIQSASHQEKNDYKR